MAAINLSSVAVGLAALILARLLYKQYTRQSLSTIRGPKSPSFVFGNLLELFQRPVGEADFAWQSLYGNVVRFKGIFGTDQLLVADPVALQKMLNTSNAIYPKLPHLRAVSRMLNGRGIVWAEGDIHKRHKNIMLPGFGQKEAKDLYPVFKECAESLSVKWSEDIVSSKERKALVNIHSWISRATLDAIGQAAFDVRFDAVKGVSHPLAKVYQNFFNDIFGLPGAREIFIQAAAKYIPTRVIEWITDHGSNSRLVRARNGKRVATNVARQLVEEKANALLRGKGNRDVFTLLVKANMDADANSRLSEDELFSQMTTLLLAGHETTATTIGWILLELARKPAVQTKLRDEIRKAEAAARVHNNTGLTAKDFDNMPYLNAVIKEGLRMHPALPNVQRMAAQDDILPLSKPVLTEDGRTTSKIVVPKGTQIVISIAMYNRLKELWGEDAHDFNPDRWLDGSLTDRKTASVGVLSNLMTFLSGTRVCLGWRFALVELQAFVAELVGKFEFTTTDKAERITRQLAIMTCPIVDNGELGRNIELPLMVSPAPQEDERS